MAGQSYTVTASTFGGPGDPGTGSTGYRGDNLNAHPDSFAELSNNPSALDFSALGNLPHGTPVTVTNPANGRSLVLYKRDVGAGGAGIGGTKRGIDLWYKAAQQLGINGLGVVKVTVGNHAPGAVKGVAQHRAGAVSPGSSTTTTTTTGGTTDYGSAIVDALLNSGSIVKASGQPSSSLGGGLLSKVMANVATGNYTTPTSTSATTTSTGAQSQAAVKGVAQAHSGVSSHSALAAGQYPTGVTNWGGKPVAKWIAPILQYARDHGWTGSVSSGYRSFADQQRIYNSGVRPAAVPGTSNHEGDAFPRGAVDVTQAAQLSQVLAHSPYASVLIWAGGKDPVHFSHPHGGGY